MSKPKKIHNAFKEHDNGVDILNDLFDVTPAKIFLSGWDKYTGRLTPFRRKPDVPPMRPEAATRKRRKARKVAHESRRRNRA